MSIYSELVDDWGFDPMAPGPEIPQWRPWSMRGAWEAVLGRTDMTVWTADNARQLNQLLVSMDHTQIIPLVTDETQIMPAVVEDVTSETMTGVREMFRAS